MAVDPAQQFDLIYQFYPWADFFKESIWEGRLPLWNPYNYLGTPFLANPQTALLFPLTWLHLIFPLLFSFTLIFLLKVALSLAGMYLWLSELRLKPEACLIGALVFGLSVHSVAGLPFPYSSVNILLPWALLASRRLLREPSRLNFAATTTVLTLIVVAGQPQSTLPAFLMVWLNAVLLFFKPTRISVARVSLLGAAFACAGLISAVQWMPSFEYVWESMVPLGPRIIKSGFPYSAGCFVNLLVPDFFGSPVRGDYWGFPGFHDQAFYCSALTLLLAPLSILYRFYRNAERIGVVPGLASPLLALALSSGIVLGLPLFETLLDVPSFDLVRRSKFVFLLTFCLAELAARGANSVASHRGGEPRRARAVIVTAAAAWLVTSLISWNWFGDFLSVLDPQDLVEWQLLRTGALVGLATVACVWIWGRKAVLLLALLVLIDLVWVTYNLSPRGTPEALFPDSAVVDRLQEIEGRPARVLTFDNVLFPNSSMIYRVQDLQGYDVMTPRRLFRYMQKVEPSLGNAYRSLIGFDPDSIHVNTRMRTVVDRALERYGDELREYLKRESYWSVGVGAVEDDSFYRSLNLDFVLSSRVRSVPGFEEAAPLGGVRIWSDPEARLGRLYFDWTEGTASGALNLMGQVDPETEVVVEATLPTLPASASGSHSVQLVEWAPQFSRYVIDADQPAVLVEFQRFSSGWRARLNGEEGAVFPANFIFRGVYLPAGHHEVELYYAPVGFRYGSIVTVLGLGLLSLFLILGGRFLRRR